MSSCVQRQLWQIEFVSTTELNLPLLGVQVLQHRLIHLLECRCLFLSSLMTVAGLTCNTRAVSRIPTVPIALLAFRHRAMAHNIRALAVGAWSTCVIIVARYHTGGSVPLRHPSRMADQQLCNTFHATMVRVGSFPTAIAIGSGVFLRFAAWKDSAMSCFGQNWAR